MTDRPTRHTNEMDGFYMSSGTYVTPLDLQPEQVLLSDIVTHLGNTCRFNGGTTPWYSVAEHSIRVSRFLAPHGSVPLELWGLMHDASEAYLCDLPRPLKHASGEFGELYRDVETKAMVAIAEALDLPTLSDPELALLKHADLVLLATEKRDLQPNIRDVSWEVLDGIDPQYDRILHPFTPRQAQQAFRLTYERLTRLLDQREAA